MPHCQTIRSGNYPRSSTSSEKGWSAIGLAKFRDMNTKKKKAGRGVLSSRRLLSWAVGEKCPPRQAEGSNPRQPACQPFKKKKEAKAHGIDWMWTGRIPPVFRPAITETSGDRRSQNGEKELPPSKPKKLQPGTERAHQTAWRREGRRGREGRGRKSGENPKKQADLSTLPEKPGLCGILHSE